METERDQIHTISNKGHTTKEKTLLPLQKEILLQENKKNEKKIEMLDLTKEKLIEEVSHLKMKKDKIMK